MKPLALAVLWAAVLHRIYVLRRGGSTTWRAHLLVAITALAIATTLHFYRAEFDTLTGVPSLAGVVDRVILTVSWAAVQLYLIDLRRLDGSARAHGREIRLAVAVMVVVAMVVSWFAIPVHQSDVTDLTPYAHQLAVLVYTAGFYGYVGWLLLDLGVLRRLENARNTTQGSFWRGRWCCHRPGVCPRPRGDGPVPRLRLHRLRGASLPRA